MIILVLGLFLFLGTHSVRIFAEGWRTAQIARLGEKPWKRLYSAASAAGLGLVVWGFGLARADSAFLWQPPDWTRHVTALATLPAFFLVTAAYVPGSRIKAAIGHPMIAGVMLWAGGHLAANGRLADVVLFGAFLVWAALDFGAARARDRAAGVRYPAGRASRDWLVVGVGLAAWVVFAGLLHAWVAGVRPY